MTTTTAMQPAIIDDRQEQELTDTAFVIDGKVYKIVYVVRWFDSKTVSRYEDMGVESAIYTGIGSRSDIRYYIQRKLNGEYVIVDRRRVGRWGR